MSKIEIARKLVEAARKIALPQGGGSADFIELVKSKLDIGDRQIKFKNESSLVEKRFDNVYVNFINLPKDTPTAGGGAEAENNRTSFWIRGFEKSDPNAPPPSGKVKIELSNTALPGDLRKKFRAKTGTPEAIAKYLADFLNKVVKDVPPNFTHTGR